MNGSISFLNSGLKIYYEGLGQEYDNIFYKDGDIGWIHNPLLSIEDGLLSYMAKLLEINYSRNDIISNFCACVN